MTFFAKTPLLSKLAMGGRKLILILWIWLGALALHAGTYKLTDGQTVSGDPVSYDRNGILFRNNLAKRYAWTLFTQEALHQLRAEAKPQDASFIDPYLEEVQQQARQSKEITVKPVDRVELPKGHTGWLAGFASPLGLLIFAILYGANLYAAYEISLFKNLPAAMVMGTSAALPVIGPIVFLFLPGKPEIIIEEDTYGLIKNEKDKAAKAAEESAAAAAPAVPVVEETNVATETPVTPATPLARPPASQPKFKTQSMAKQPVADPEPQPEAPASSAPAAVTFKRGDFTFNRRFFETKMPGFLRIVPGELEKQTVLYIRGTRGEFIGQRISSINATELYLQVFKENATAEEKIPFTEIQEVQLRPKDSV